MLANIQKYNISKLLQQRNAFLTVAIGLLLTNILLTIILFNKRERVIIVPAYLKQSFWSEGELVSPHYLEEMALFFAQLMLNASADTQGYRRDVILRYIAPESHTALEKKLLAEQKRFAKEGVATRFMPKGVEVDTSALQVKVKGLLDQYIAGTRVKQSLEEYIVQFTYVGGILMLKDFISLQETYE
jgi:conjugal transfer pilus assembly protein TraE